eukprot:CAMPEP_0206256134 /NCGR_PEP_ID=MMETSP0047_2-20121206/24607_1 /ASSEMBLY_ACC=CAM_ASM_000192 /TAXON_ID=195065 /ORGANISM="Chroomonas mesostigmatica_cf, Strain CCMP1168" /LENGTH=344 /DNA_ID=CAMNT_0053682557 /DNA_START=251 /DNA_END=1286 /DNA_ORIENTATION=+
MPPNLSDARAQNPKLAEHSSNGKQTHGPLAASLPYNSIHSFMPRPAPLARSHPECTRAQGHAPKQRSWPIRETAPSPSGVALHPVSTRHTELDPCNFVALLAKGLGLDLERLLDVLERLVALSEVQKTEGYLYMDAANAWIRVPHRLPHDSERLPAARQRLCVSPLLSVLCSNVGEHDGDIWMLVPEPHLEDAEGLLVALQRLRLSALVGSHACNVVERGCDMLVLVPVPLLVDTERLIQALERLVVPSLRLMHLCNVAERSGHVHMIGSKRSQQDPKRLPQLAKSQVVLAPALMDRPYQRKGSGGVRMLLAVELQEDLERLLELLHRLIEPPLTPQNDTSVLK